MANLKEKTKEELISEIERLQEIIDSDYNSKSATGISGTERKSPEFVKAEERLWLSKERFRGIVENTDVGYFFIDNKGIIRQVNDAWLRMYKYDSADEIVGKHFKVIQMFDDVEKAKEYVNGILKGKTEYFTGEFSRKCKDDTIGYHSFSAHPVHQFGKVIGIEGFIIDITKRKLAEEELRKTRMLLKASVESQNDMIILSIDKSYRYLYFNNVHKVDMKQAYNIDIEIGMNILECVTSDDDRRKLKIHYNRVLSGESYSTIEEYGNINRTYYESFFNPILNEQNEIIGVSTFARNITERMQVAEKLQKSEARYRMLFNEMLDGFALHEMIFDKSGKPVDYRFLDINPAFEQMTGLTTEMVIGKTVLEVIPELESYWIETYGKVTLTGEPIRFKNYFSPLKKHFEITAFRPKEGQFACIFIDITEQKQMEEQLRQTEKMGAIGQLAGGIAHDFNNQLEGILIYTEMLREKVGYDAGLTRYADNIIIGIKRSADLTSELLAFSRQGKYQKKTVNMHNILNEVINMLQHSIDKRIVIKQHLNANPPTTIGDPTQLQNMVLNLALNARDAMHKGGELLFSTDVVHIEEASKKNNFFKIAKGSYIRVCVTDTGIGMDKEIRQHVFEPFFTTKEKGKGTGMGLAAVYGTVKSHDGAVDIYSEPGKGTTFSIYLPLYMEEGFEFGKKLQASSVVRGTAHILLVEDEEMIRTAEAELLEILGYKVSVCSNGAEAVTFYKESWKQVDIVIIDMVMPEMNGKDAFILMREINPDIIALLASGYSLNGESQTILDEGVKGFIQKPFMTGELTQKIAELLNTK